MIIWVRKVELARHVFVLGLGFLNVSGSGQTIATSHDRFSPIASWGREIPLLQGNLGWWNIIIWPDWMDIERIVRYVFHEAPKMWPLVELALLFLNQYATSLCMHVMHVQQLVYDIHSAWTTLILWELPTCNISQSPGAAYSTDHPSGALYARADDFDQRLIGVLDCLNRRPAEYLRQHLGAIDHPTHWVVRTTVCWRFGGFGDARMNGRWKVNDFDSTQGFDMFRWPYWWMYW